MGQWMRGCVGAWLRAWMGTCVGASVYTCVCAWVRAWVRACVREYEIGNNLTKIEYAML